MTDASTVPAEFKSAFLAACGSQQAMSFERFMALALYDPHVGYYRGERERVGRGHGTDFYTATSSGPLFGELIAAACTSLLHRRDLKTYTFIEIGSESPNGVLDGVAHPFKSVRTLRLGEPLNISGQCIVFSNELLDAQPFRRFIGRSDGWHELGVALRDDRLVEFELAKVNESFLPTPAVTDYVIDAPVVSADLTREIAEQPWTGLFVAFDYGKTWREIVESCPAGTARAYYRHTQSNDLLAHPSQQDLTCHICWDWISSALERAGFHSPKVEFQESFLIHNAGEAIAAISSAEAARFSPRKASLLQLLHPTHMGQKFQVLHALRD